MHYFRGKTLFLNKRMLISFKKFLLFLAIFLLLILAVQFFQAQSFTEKIPLQVSFLDVGQGDAILINYQNQYQILIDSGVSNKQILSELSHSMPAQDRFIEVVIATHYDKDHVGGMRAVLENYKVALFLDNGQFSGTEATTVVSDLLKNKNIPHQQVLENSRIEFGEDLRMEFFNPDGEVWSANDNSVVARLDFGENSFLFTGDVGFKTEKDLIMDNHNLDVDWLKVAHHGSKNSSGAYFLEKVTPKKSIISVGKNSYGHPTEETLERLRSSGSEILSTLENGRIKVDCWKKKECVIN